jgi:hypothetical protein
MFQKVKVTRQRACSVLICKMVVQGGLSKRSVFNVPPDLEGSCLRPFQCAMSWRTNIHSAPVQARLDDAEQNALKGGKKAMAKMDSRIR